MKKLIKRSGRMTDCINIHIKTRRKIGAINNRVLKTFARYLFLFKEHHKLVQRPEDRKAKFPIVMGRKLLG